MIPDVQLAPGADESGFACMLCDLLRQNLEAKPQKLGDFMALKGVVALVADDADVAVTLELRSGSCTIHAGIHGIPDVTIRGVADAVSSAVVLNVVCIVIANVSITQAATMFFPVQVS